ncbi:MAG: hypothetical protein ACRCW0_02040 [Clostridium sp.]
MPLTPEKINETIKKVEDTYRRFALGNEGFVRVDRFDVHYPEIDFKVTVRAKEMSGRDRIFHRRHTIYSITSDIEGTIDVTKIEESADKLTLTLHTPAGNPSLSIEDAKQLIEFFAMVLA